MSDFTSGFWSVYITVITLGGIIGCGILLWVNSGRPAAEPVEVKSHVWDETLQEYNNPLPRWWMGLFWITIVFALGFLALYPGLGSYRGSLGWTELTQYEEEVAQAKAKYDPIFNKFLQQDVKAVAANPEARQMGERLFLTYCAQCHGSDARGAKGFPNLADNDWQWGGAPEQIQQTIAEGRIAAMPPFAQLGAETIKDLANYVRSLSNLAHDSARAQKGREAFQSAGCIACHGPDAKGNNAMGAPNLTDGTWLYSSNERTIIEGITKGRNNRMPALKEFLGGAKVHLLAAYVYGLSGGSQKP